MGAAGLCRTLLCPAALLVALATGACDAPDLVGTWVGHDGQGASEVYSFNADGTGVHSVDDRSQPLTYRLRPGYPNVIEVTLGGSGPDSLRRGLLTISWDGRMRLELGAPGGPIPEQLSARAAVLTRPATR